MTLWGVGFQKSNSEIKINHFTLDIKPAPLGEVPFTLNLLEIYNSFQEILISRVSKMFYKGNLSVNNMFLF